MNVLAVVPARGGSKGVPGKNVREVEGKPLLVWTLETALASKLVGMVCLSSESREVLAAGRPTLPDFDTRRLFFLQRPAELATDEAATDPVLVHAVQALESMRYERPDYVVLLQPTVPARRAGLIDECIQRAVETGADSLHTAYRLHFVWWPELDYSAGPGPVRSRWATQCRRRPRRQDMRSRECMYHEDGSVYVTRTSYLLEHGARIALSAGGHVEVYETERTEDVDTLEDCAVAAARLRYRHGVEAMR